ncbi:F-box/kelch-repeat protein At3g23880 [Lactuca sativa]|uniref:F-box domain-containing protein n=1 Tax=Lactuca sativa TaxID=4236 RepID=A0A9R1V2R2_LACSA|nr:F-box/kelch-repeat protein At3g23880 [Lactuca sativa]KAJ0198223.1 hypothetical protein LSAT_V11C700344090 [Lactuca sativa]
MCEYEIPFHIQEEIMKRLPVKSLIQFRSVSKAWKSLIDSSEFIAAHSLRCHTHPQHLLVSYEDPEEGIKYVSYIDGDTFRQQRSLLTVPVSIKGLKKPVVVGSSHGLLCLYGSDPELTTKMVALWNPSIRKSIVVAVPDQLSVGKSNPSVGFGVCSVTSDPKIVLITQSWDDPNIETSYRFKVLVYNLSSGKWRNLSTDLPAKPVRDWSPVVVTDRFIYSHSAGSSTHNMIMSFDVTNETFESIDLLDTLAHHHPVNFFISKVRDSLAMFKYSGEIYPGGDICTVWMMEHGIQKLFTKLFDIKTPHDFIVGFRKNGIPIIQVTYDDDDDDEPPRLVVYEPNSKHNNFLEISVYPFSFNVNSYMETLLLL